MPNDTVFASVLDAAQNPEAAGIVRVDPTFLARYQHNIDWLVDRLAKSTAGVRGLIVERLAEARPDLAAADASPQLNLAVVALIAQAYANYFRELGPERHAAFIGFDGRYFSHDYARLFSRIFAGNGLRAWRDQNEEPTPTPVTSFAAVRGGLGGAIMITASHNPPVYNGIKSSTWYGGVDTDDISEQIANHVRALTQGGGEIRFAPLSSDRIGAVDAKGNYLESYLKVTFDEGSLGYLRRAMQSGARFLFDGLFGVGGMAIARYLDGLFPGEDWRKSVELLNITPDPAIGGIAKPDPSDPKTLELSGAIDFLTRYPETLLSVTADMDADRIGTAVIIPADQVATARTFGLFVSEFAGSKGSVWAVRFTPNQLFTLIAYDRMLAAARQEFGTDDPAELRRTADAPERKRFHLITSIPSSIIVEKLAQTFGLSLQLTPVGFKNLGRMAYEIDQRKTGDIVLCLMEESGGAQIGPFRPWNDRGDTIHRDKDTCALALALFCLAARLRGEGRSLLEFYVEMAQAFGSLAYYERLDAYLPDQETAEDPDQQAVAEAAKKVVLDRLVALQQPDHQAKLLSLFGLQPSGAAAGEHELRAISLMEKVEGEWQMAHPVAKVIPLADGGRLEWFRAGTYDHDGMRLTGYDAGGHVRFWSLVRASGTEALLRVYMEIVEPIDEPRPERLLEVFDPLLRYLGLDADGFAAQYRKKYGL